MKIYTLAADSFSEEEARLLRTGYTASLAALAAATLLAIRTFDFSPGLPLFASLAAVTMAVVLSVSLGFLGIYRGLRRRRTQWESYVLTLTNDRIICRRDGVADLQIPYAAITGFEETLGRGLYIKTANRLTFIFVPVQLVGYQDLRAELGRWRPLPPRRREPLWRSPFFIGAVCLGAWSILWTSSNYDYDLAAAFVLIVFLVSTFVSILFSPHSSRAAKRSSWFFLAAAALALLKLLGVIQVQ